MVWFVRVCWFPVDCVGSVLGGLLEAGVGAFPFLALRYVQLAHFLFIIAVLIVRPRGIGGLLDDTRE